MTARRASALLVYLPDMKTKTILDTKIPPDFGGVFDGDSFGEREFLAWCRTATTYPKIKLRTSNKNNLIYSLKTMRKRHGIELYINHISQITVEITFQGKKWNY